MRNPRVWNYHTLVQRRYRGRILGWLALVAFVLLAIASVRFLYPPGSFQVRIKLPGTRKARCISSC